MSETVKPTEETAVDLSRALADTEARKVEVEREVAIGELDLAGRTLDYQKSILEQSNALAVKDYELRKAVTESELALEEKQLDAQTAYGREALAAQTEIAEAYIEYLGSRSGQAAEQFSPAGVPYVTVQAPEAADYSTPVVLVGAGLLLWWILS